MKKTLLVALVLGVVIAMVICLEKKTEWTVKLETPVSTMPLMGENKDI